MNRIGISIGDPAGVGPEIALAALADPGVAEGIRARIFCAPAVLDHLAAQLDRRAEYDCVAASDLEPGEFRPGHFDPACARAQVACLAAAADALAAGEIDALVTGPIHKRALAICEQVGPGQTEWLADRFGVERAVMMLAGPRLKVVLATTHLPLREVASRLEIGDLVSILCLAAREIGRLFGLPSPRLGMAALNPHGEERGELGLEERTILQPAIGEARRRGVDVCGPVPADTLFAQAAAGRFDAAVACYHDQGLGPLKALHFAEAVNTTLGLGHVRTSPDHGPAYDIAWQGLADASSMKAAIRLADEMATRRAREER
ncbi:MAG: 4-hydroxythreonine-4-phosphate dehydrogenase PdxA [Deltaproteobacteria bacterium]|nr:4-hydroxythreonine-4-phosphate dehydrogenase PdxA [Deltaproteobacteria bacterium]